MPGAHRPKFRRRPQGDDQDRARSRVVEPTKMMELPRVAIEAFHSDPETGTVDQTARRVPGSNSPIAAVRSATRCRSPRPPETKSWRATTSGSGSLTHLLRKSLATDLVWISGIEGIVRRRCMGYRAGEGLRAHLHPRSPWLRQAAVRQDTLLHLGEGLVVAVKVARKSRVRHGVRARFQTTTWSCNLGGGPPPGRRGG